jgi:LuxR family quorum sensing-dependent transcriptional regulator
VAVAVPNFDDTLAYIDTIQKSRTSEDVCRALIDVTGRFGLTALLAGTVPKPGTPQEDQRSHVLLCDWPKDWMERYVAMNYVDRDPLVTFMKRSPSAVYWHDAIEKVGADRDGRRVYGDAGAFKLKDGFAMPLVTLEGEVVMVSLGGEEVELSDEAVGVISLASTFAIGRAMQLASAAPVIEHKPELTVREKECMRWAALGKSEWEISQILGISEHTSEKHLLNAKAKLGAANRVQAVAEAIRHGYIS